jgi:hypothetical protein
MKEKMPVTRANPMNPRAISNRLHFESDRVRYESMKYPSKRYTPVLATAATPREIVAIKYAQ